MSKTLTNNVITFPFTESFIDNFTDYLIREYVEAGRDLSKLCIVFGGKRPALFLKRALAKRIKSAFNAPRIMTIDEFVQYTVRQSHPFVKAQDLDSCYNVYSLARSHCPEILAGRESFAAFLPWAREILRFIDQLDLENVDNKKLTSLKENAHIGYGVPDEINQLLKHIITLRTQYHKQMNDAKAYSRGYQYLQAAGTVEQLTLKEFEHVIFANFFYFNRSEETVVKTLFDRGNATLVFQGDARRWPVLARTAKRFSIQIAEGNEVKPTHFDLHLHKGFDAHSQVGLVRTILQGIKNTENTVVVLPNPDHIIPLLSEITGLIKDYNISMGYPLKRSSLYALLQMIFRAQLSFDNGRYYAKDYLKAIRHPFVKNLSIGTDANVTRILIHKIEEVLTGLETSEISGSLFIGLADIENCTAVVDLTKEMLTRLHVDVNDEQIRTLLKTIHATLFKQWEEVGSFTHFAYQMQATIAMIVNNGFVERYPLNINIAEKIARLTDEFRTSSFADEVFAKEELFRIFETQMDSEIMAFSGSPLKGMQLLGLFETRSLNFENVIVLDVNEGVLPHLNLYEPLVPREVMISLNLDRMELEEEIQRYQFMRLISSAKNVHLVYQESKDKEPSRFIEELVWEQEKRANAMNIIKPKEAAFNVNIAKPARIVQKTPAMIEFLTQHRYSASSINTYLRNPMDFYYNYVLGLREKEDLLDEPDAAQVGTFVHALLEDEFQIFKGEKPNIDAAFVQRFLQTFELRFAETFGRSMKSDAFLLKSVLQERLKFFLDHEATSDERQVSEVVALEQKLTDTIALGSGTFEFSFIVDRIDRMADGSVMIVDYKTGASDITPQSLERVASLELTRENIRDTVKSFQLPLYLYVLAKQYPGVPINAALYNLRTLKLSKFLKYPTSDVEPLLRPYLDALEVVMAEICDSDVPFVNDPV